MDKISGERRLKRLTALITKANRAGDTKKLRTLEDPYRFASLSQARRQGRRPALKGLTSTSQLLNITEGSKGKALRTARQTRVAEEVASGARKINLSKFKAVGAAKGGKAVGKSFKAGARKVMETVGKFIRKIR